MLKFLILFVIITFASTSPQQTSPQYVGLHVHLTYMPRLQTRLSTSMKKLRSCAVTFVFSCQAPCQASFRPLPLRLKSRWAQCTLSTTPSFSSTFLVATKQINHLTFRRTTVGWKLMQFGNWCLYTGISWNNGAIGTQWRDRNISNRSIAILTPHISTESSVLFLGEATHAGRATYDVKFSLLNILPFCIHVLFKVGSVVAGHYHFVSGRACHRSIRRLLPSMWAAWAAWHGCSAIVFRWPVS